MHGKVIFFFLCVLCCVLCADTKTNFLKNVVTSYKSCTQIIYQYQYVCTNDQYQYIHVHVHVHMYSNTCTVHNTRSVRVYHTYMYTHVLPIPTLVRQLFFI